MRLTCLEEEEAGRKEAPEVETGFGSGEPVRGNRRGMKNYDNYNCN